MERIYPNTKGGIIITEEMVVYKGVHMTKKQRAGHLAQETIHKKAKPTLESLAKRIDDLRAYNERELNDIIKTAGELKILFKLKE